MYKTVSGTKIYRPEQYAKTGKPMINKKGKNINAKTSIYEIKCTDGKRYIGKTTNMDRRMRQYFTGNGAQVTRKFAPVSATQIATCNGYFSNEVEQQITEEKIHKYGYGNVRGGCYTNSKTLTRGTKRPANNKQNSCYRCGRYGHWATSCYAKSHVNGHSLNVDK